MKNPKCILCVILCLSFALSLCSCGRLSGRYDGYEVETIYREDGYTSKYAYQLFRKEEYNRISFFGFPIFEINEDSYTIVNPDSSLTKLKFDSEHELLTDKKEHLFELIYDEEKIMLEDMMYYKILELPDANYAVFYKTIYHRDETTGYYPDSTAPDEYYYRLYKYNDREIIKYVEFSVPKPEINAIFSSFGISKQEEYALIPRDDMLCIHGLVWFDYNLNEVEREPKLSEAKIDTLWIKEKLSSIDNEALNSIAQDNISIRSVIFIDDIYYCMFSTDSNCNMIIEITTEGNIKVVLKLGFVYDYSVLKQVRETNKGYDYYDIEY